MSVENDHDAPVRHAPEDGPVMGLGRAAQRARYALAFLRLSSLRKRREEPAVCAKLRANIRLLNVIAAGRSALFIIPVIMPFALLKAGVSPGQFMMAEAVFALTVVVMEVPSGWIADIWTRRLSMVAGLAFETVGFVILWAMQNVWHLLIGQVVVGVGVSLISGTASALLYDSLLEARMTKAYRRLEGLRHGVGLYAVGASSIVGALLYAVSPDLVMAMTVAAVGGSAVLSLFLYEPQRATMPVQGNPVRDVLVALDQGVRKDPYLGRFMVLAAVMFGVTNAAFWTQQPYYMALGLPVSLFGLFSAGGHLCGGLGAQMAHCFERHLRVRSLMLMILVWLCAAYLVSGALPGLWGAFLLMSGGLAYGIGFPIVNDEINKRVSSARRATMLSVASLAMRLVFVVLGLGLGGVMDRYGVALVLIALAGILAAGGSLAFVALWRQETRQERRMEHRLER